MPATAATRRRNRLRPVLTVEQARLSTQDRTVTFDDPTSPWLVDLTVAVAGGQARIGALHIQVRDMSAPVTTARLTRLPSAQMLHVAARLTLPEGHPNELYYRMLAAPKPPGSRQWPAGHWRRVLDVYDWAVDTQRPGGGAQAVADMWGINRTPTAYRWLRQARAETGTETEGAAEGG